MIRRAGLVLPGFGFRRIRIVICSLGATAIAPVYFAVRALEIETHVASKHSCTFDATSAGPRGLDVARAYVRALADLTCTYAVHAAGTEGRCFGTAND